MFKIQDANYETFKCDSEVSRNPDFQIFDISEFRTPVECRPHIGEKILRERRNYFYVTYNIVVNILFQTGMIFVRLAINVFHRRKAAHFNHVSVMFHLLAEEAIFA